MNWTKEKSKRVKFDRCINCKLWVMKLKRGFNLEITVVVCVACIEFQGGNSGSSGAVPYVAWINSGVVPKSMSELDHVNIFGLCVWVCILCNANLTPDTSRKYATELDGIAHNRCITQVQKFSCNAHTDFEFCILFWITQDTGFYS